MLCNIVKGLMETPKECIVEMRIVQLSPALTDGMLTIKLRTCAHKTYSRFHAMQYLDLLTAFEFWCTVERI